MATTTDAPGEPESRTPWWLDEMIDRANSGRGRYEIAIPATVLEDWIANIRPALAALAAARPVVAATADWGRARRAEVAAVQDSFDANHRGPAWFARCVAGETRVAAEGDLFAAWEEYDAALAAREGAGEAG